MQAVLFDLDGTLLPMDIDVFTRGYFRLLSEKASHFGYEPEELVKGIIKSTSAMVTNDGSSSNKERFWNCFAGLIGERAYDDMELFDSFYEKEFREAVSFTEPEPEKAQTAVRLAHEVAQKVILATNPIFPAVGVATRLDWLGLKTSDFDYVTSYENSSYCKPNTKYYTELMSVCGLRPEMCLMIGNDVQEDICPASAAGMKTFLLKNCMICRNDAEVPGDAGGWDELTVLLRGLK